MPELKILIGTILSFAITASLTAVLKSRLPADIGRAFAVNSQAAKGKPRGAGIIFVCVACVLMTVFTPFKVETLIYAALMLAAMISGFLDDASKAPWGEYKKGLIDLIISFGVAFTYVSFNGSSMRILIAGTEAVLPVWLYILLGTVLVWASINVTNCTDGVDGLSSTLSLISLGGFLYVMETQNSEFAGPILIFAASIAAYLLFNASPSILLMGDAGSRTIGVFFAICAMKTGSPLLFIPICLVFIIDGGLGLIKVALLRFLKIKILANTRTPIHDHVRKNKGWSDTHTVIRFAVIHLMIVFVTLCLLFKVL